MKTPYYLAFTISTLKKIKSYSAKFRKMKNGNLNVENFLITEF